MQRPVPEHDVFISYARRDARAVEALASRLAQQAGLRVWLDRTALNPGEPWRSEIEHALNTASAALIVWGPDGLGAVQLQERDLAYVIRDARPDFRLIHVFLPGVEPPQASWANVDTWVRFESGLDEADAYAALVAALKGQATRQQLAAELPDRPSPFRGLSPFSSGDTGFFFGRSVEVAQMLERLRRDPFLAVVGPSGCGKTSLVQAGLLPRLAELDANGSGEWVRIELRPGARPSQSLAAALARTQPAGARLDLLERLSRQIRQQPAALATLLDTLTDQDRPAIIVVDRLEELFALCTDPAEREAFAVALLSAAGRARVVVTMRADFYGELGAIQALADRVVSRQIYLKPLHADGVTEVIEAPAAQVGAVFEKGLADQLRLDAQGSDEVVLPFLQHALELLWRRRRGRWLTWDAYREIGGMTGALRYHADGVMDALTGADAGIARRLLTGLVWLGDTGRTVTARSASTDELFSRVPQPERASAVLQRLADERLVVIRAESAGEAVTADIVHDTLPRYWARLKGWIESDRAFLQWRQRLHLAESEWRRLEEDPGSLLHGAALLEAERWLAERGADLGAGERRFVERGRAERDQALRARERRRRRVLAGVSAAMALALVLAGMLGWQWRLAREQTRAAQALQWTAEAQMLADAQPSRLQDVALLAAESMRTVPTRQAYQVLLASVALMPHREAALPGHSKAINRLRFSSDGRLLISASDDHWAAVWDWRERRTVLELAHQGAVNLALLSPDGTLAATASDDNTAALWDATSGARLHVLAHQDDVVDLAFSHDGRYLATASHDGSGRLWQVDGGALVRAFPMRRWVTSVAFSPDDRYLAIGAGDAIEVWADNLGRAGGGTPPDRDRLANERPGGALVWDLVDGREVVRTRQGLGVYDVAFSPDSRLFATAGADRSAETWDIATGAALARVAHEDVVKQVAFSPDGRYVASISGSGLFFTSASNTAKAWDPKTGEELARLRIPDTFNDLAESPTGRTFVVAGGDRTARVLEPLRQREIARIGLDAPVLAVAFAPDARHVAVAGSNGELSVWEIPASAADFGFALGWGSQAMALSADGAYFAGQQPDGTVQLWKLGANQPSATLEGKARVVWTDVASGGRYVATSDSGSVATLWDGRSGKVIARRALDDLVGKVIVAPQGDRWAFTNFEQGEVSVVSVSADREDYRIVHAGGFSGVEFSPDWRWLATAGKDGSIRLWDGRDGREHLTLPPGPEVRALAFSASGRLLAAATDDRVQIVTVEDGGGVDRIAQSGGPLAFDPSERYLAVASGNLVRLWDRERAEEIGRIPHAASIDRLAFSADGRLLVTTSGEMFARQHTVQRWRWRPDDLVAEACARATANLRQAVWARYFPDLPYRRSCQNLPVDTSDAVRYAAALAKEGDASGARAAYRRAVRWATEAGDAAACNEVCWSGGLDGQATPVMPACEYAVAHATLDLEPFYRDSRGLARALSGDRAGAVDDFTAFVDGVRARNPQAPALGQRQAWIEAIESGRNPFDADTLNALRGEP